MAQSFSDDSSGLYSSPRKKRMNYNSSPDLFGSSEEDNEYSLNNKENTKKSWLGSSLFSFTKLTPTNLNIPPLSLTCDHDVYVKLPLRGHGLPLPYPNSYEDCWDGRHVRMPNSPESLYPITSESREKSRLRQRWLVIQDAFAERITSFAALRTAILSYNKRYESRWRFQGLQYLLEEEFCDEERLFFFQTILTNIVRLSLDLPRLITKPVLLLQKNMNHSITLSQKQIASLLANAFLCTFPRRNARGAHTEFASYPDINFNRLFGNKEQCVLEKLKCIIHYFKEISERGDQLDGLVTFTRQCIEVHELPDFQMSNDALTKLYTDSRGFIEKASGFLQVDFANKFIGGGVLGLGCVQEEIRFVLCPELLVTLLFTEELGKHEVLVITGVEQFSEVNGYGSDFEWRCPYKDRTPRDPFRRKLCQVVAVDAIDFYRNPQLQYKAEFITRELRKAYCGFRPLPGSEGDNTAVATGNWGCGAFRGDPRLKSLIQIAAASLAGRDVIYYTFGDEDLRDDLASIHQFLIEKKINVGQLVMTLYQYGLQGNSNNKDGLFDYIYKTFSSCHNYNSDTDGSSQDESPSKARTSVSRKGDSSQEFTGANKLNSSKKMITDYFTSSSSSVRKKTKEDSSSTSYSKDHQPFSSCSKDSEPKSHLKDHPCLTFEEDHCLQEALIDNEAESATSNVDCLHKDINKDNSFKDCRVKKAHSEGNISMECSIKGSTTDVFSNYVSKDGITVSDKVEKSVIESSSEKPACYTSNSSLVKCDSESLSSFNNVSRSPSYVRQNNSRSNHLFDCLDHIDKNLA